MSGSDERDATGCLPSHSHAATPAMYELAAQLKKAPESATSGIQYVSADVYLNPRRFQAERESLFGRFPVPLTPSVYLQPGDSVVHDHYGVPLILTRDRSGVAHALLNVCRHRGTRLVESCERQSVSRLACPYHSWTYALDGTLQGIPRPDTFPGMDKADYGLRSFPVREAGGMMFCRLDGRLPDESASLGELVDDFDALGLGGSVVFDRKLHRVRANWKLIMDAFLESYHVQRLHRKTIATFFTDAITASDRVGHHFRSAVARQDYTMASTGDSLDELRQRITFSYSVLPGMVVVASPDYLNVMLLYPQTVDLTLVEDYMLIQNPPATQEEHAHWEESFALLDGGVFSSEDFRAAELGQQGLASGSVDRLTIGSAEEGVAEFHRTLSELIEHEDQDAASS